MLTHLISDFASPGHVMEPQRAPYCEIKAIDYISRELPFLHSVTQGNIK